MWLWEYSERLPRSDRVPVHALAVTEKHGDIRAYAAATGRKPSTVLTSERQRGNVGIQRNDCAVGPRPHGQVHENGVYHPRGSVSGEAVH